MRTLLWHTLNTYIEGVSTLVFKDQFSIHDRYFFLAASQDLAVSKDADKIASTQYLSCTAGCTFVCAIVSGVSSILSS